VVPYREVESVVWSDFDTGSVDVLTTSAGMKMYCLRVLLILTSLLKTVGAFKAKEVPENRLHS
jgi:hypothetical protein